MRYILFSVLIFIAATGRSQHYFLNNEYYEQALMPEAGTGIGFMNCITDLGGGKKSKGISSIHWSSSKPVLNLFFGITYKNRIGLRLDVNFGSISAADSLLVSMKSHARGRYERNLSFKSGINEIQLLGEIHPLAVLAAKPGRIAPYFLAGIGYFSFNPKAELDNRWYFLRPLRTEGQGFSEYPGRKLYDLSQFNFSLGGGFRFEWNEMVNLKMEVNYRLLNTDYLDDVSTTYISPELFANYLSANQAQIAGKLYKRKLENSPVNQITDLQRGNSARNDSYFSFLLKTGILIPQSQR